MRRKIHQYQIKKFIFYGSTWCKIPQQLSQKKEKTKKNPQRERKGEREEIKPKPPPATAQALAAADDSHCPISSRRQPLTHLPLPLAQPQRCVRPPISGITPAKAKNQQYLRGFSIRGGGEAPSHKRRERWEREIKSENGVGFDGAIAGFHLGFLCDFIWVFFFFFGLLSCKLHLLIGFFIFWLDFRLWILIG